MNYDPLDEIQIAEINSQVRRYLEGTLDEIDVRNPSSGPPCSANLGRPVPGTPWNWPWNLTPSGCSGHRTTGLRVPLSHQDLSFQGSVPHRVASSLEQPHTHRQSITGGTSPARLARAESHPAQPSPC